MSSRVQSIDLFRGLTILTMVFVNDLAGVTNIPAWLKHAPDGADTMTFVDVVFPAFLYIVGMSIPLALQHRREKGATIPELLGHLLARSFGLLVLGFFMVNISQLNPELTGMSRPVWATLFFLAVIAVWSQTGLSTGFRRRFLLLIKALGILTILYLAMIYRSGDNASPGWMHSQWWGILGLIGWSYLVCSMAYLLFGANLPALTALVALAVSLYVGDKAGALAFLGRVNDVLWIGGHIGGHVSITAAGMIGGVLFSRATPASTPQQRIRWFLVMAVLLAIGGYCFRPLYGISKNMATPAWSLYSAAACCILFLGLYWIADIQRKGSLFRFAAPAGSNPLLAYILPDIFYGLLAIAGIGDLWGALGAGTPGIVRSLAFSLFIVWLTGRLSGSGLQLKL